MKIIEGLKIFKMLFRTTRQLNKAIIKNIEKVIPAVKRPTQKVAPDVNKNIITTK